MKKVLALTFSAIIIFSLCLTAFAENENTNVVYNDDGSQIIWFSDGSCIEISAPYGEEISTKGTLTTITRYKTQNKKDSDGNVEWSYTLTGTFSYTYGVSATCTAASYSKTINNTSWSFSNGSATKSGATATGVGTFTKTWLFITTDTVNVHLTLTCDRYGNVT